MNAAAEPWIRREVIGDAVLYLGDCLEVMPTLEARSVTLLWSDPPYGHNNNDGDLNARLAEQVGRGEVRAIANDGPETMRWVVDGMLREAVRVTVEDCALCVCCGGGGPTPTFAWLADRMNRDGLAFFHSVIWDKVNPGLGWRYRRRHEMIMVGHKQAGKLAWREDAPPIDNVVQGYIGGAQRQHPNEKPLWMPRGFIERHTEPGDLVLDPFMGGGTTGVAALQLGRRFIGVELDPEHFETSCRRIEEASRSGAELFAPTRAKPPEQAGLFAEEKPAKAKKVRR